MLNFHTEKNIIEDEWIIKENQIFYVFLTGSMKCNFRSKDIFKKSYNLKGIYSIILKFVEVIAKYFTKKTVGEFANS